MLVLVLVLLGVGVAWVSGLGALYPFKPYLLAATAAFLAWSGTMLYRPKKACAIGSLCAPAPDAGAAQRILGGRRQRDGRGAATGNSAAPAAGLGEIAMHLKTIVSTTALALLLGTGFAADAAPRSVTLALEGMYCAMCPVTVKTALDFADGVAEVKVDRDPDEAAIRYDDARTGPAKLVEAVIQSGYGSHVKPPRAKP